MGMEPTLSVVIVSYNSRSFLRQSLPPLFRLEPELPTEIIVVDNASTDGTAQNLAREYGERITLIANNINCGFGRACNQGMERAKGKYFLLLNPDTIPSPGAVKSLVAVLDLHPKIGVVGCKLVYEDGRTQLSVYRDLTVVRYWTHHSLLSPLFEQTLARGQGETLRHAQWLTGACLLARREACEQVGYFDERYFMYFEDADWCRRFRKAGWHVAYEPRVQFTHLQKQSSGKAKFRTLTEFYKSLRRFARQHLSVPARFGLRLSVTLDFVLRLPVYSFRYAMAGRAERTAARERLSACAFVLRDIWTGKD